MQFVKDGPDVPDSLIQYHEDGNVVFFCGAGISYPARLPGFKELVERIYRTLPNVPDSIESAAIDRHQYDAALDLLEHRQPGGRFVVRNALVQVLKPHLRAAGAKATHRALLTLAQHRKVTRLVTTNFDRLFEIVMRDRAYRTDTFAAPLRPTPKAATWHGLVYLHGLISKTPTERELNRLVVSSGDFGRAYLTERWASRFVSELFRKYIVCFVGYSIEDPVLKYTMDALAADRMMGETVLPSYAFASFESGKRDTAEKEWLAKRVTPILYAIPPRSDDHGALHNTLSEWAATHRDGVNGKEQIVVRHALSKPSGSTLEDNFEGRVIWALSDKRGLPAKRFAEFDPVPPLDWLTPMSAPRFRHTDLIRFGVSPHASPHEALQFSLVLRPSPYDLASNMSLIASPGWSGWDHVMFHIASWLVRHVDNPALILWLAEKGGAPHPRFEFLIRQQIAKSAPSTPMLVLWRLMLAGRVGRPAARLDFYQWFRDLTDLGYLSASLRALLRELLEAKVKLSKPYKALFREPGDFAREPTIKELVNWDVILTGEYASVAIRDSANNAIWQVSLPHLVSDFADQLRAALDLMKELGGASEQSDFSYVHQPSIAPSARNQHFEDWTILIDLTRDAWSALAATDADRARIEVQRWRSSRYPTFRRLVFYALQTESVFSPHEGMEALLEDDHWWLWSPESQREAMQLLEHIVSHLTSEDGAALEQAVLAGPPRSMYRDDLDEARWQDVVDETTWLRLAAWKTSESVLPARAQSRFNALQAADSTRRTLIDEDQQFPFSIKPGVDWREHIAVPMDFRLLPDWIRAHPNATYQKVDNWQELCKARFKHAAWALIHLSRNNEWPIDRWQDALQAWSDDSLRERSWRWLHATISRFPPETLLQLARSLVFWLRPMADMHVSAEVTWLKVLNRIIEIHRDETAPIERDPVGSAINHPVGQATESILHWWFRTDLKDNQGLSNMVGPIFTTICDRRVHSFRFGRVILATNVITLFRVDQQWTRTNLIPLFDWASGPVEARYVWEGFLWAPRIYFPLLVELKAALLATSNHYEELEKHSEQFAAFLVFVALQRDPSILESELARATSALPVVGLERSAKALVAALEGAGEQTDEYWRNRIVPYLRGVWPQSIQLRTREVSAEFARLCIAAKTDFPAALDALAGWLQPLMRPDYVTHLLNNSNLSSQFPSSALRFLDMIVGDIAEWISSDLGQCLDKIEGAQADLSADPAFIRLRDFSRQRGI